VALNISSSQTVSRRVRLKLTNWLILFVVTFSGFGFGDIITPGYKHLFTKVMVQGLDEESKVKDGGTLVAVNRFIKSRKAQKVKNNEPINSGYKFSKNTAYFLSAELLATVHGDVNAVNYDDEKLRGLTVAPIEILHPTQVKSTSPVVSRTVIYTVE
jgi:hypothetical protein